MKQAALLNLPLDFEFKGEAYKIGPTTFQVEGMFASWVYAQTLRRLERARELEAASPGSGMTEEQYRQAMDRVTDNVAAGDFEWGGLAVARSAGNTAGAKHLLFLRMQSAGSRVTRQTIDDIFADGKAMERLGALLNPRKAGEGQSDTTPAEEAPAEAVAP